MSTASPSISSRAIGAIKSLAPTSIMETTKIKDLKQDVVDIRDAKPGITTDYGVPVPDTDRWLKLSNGENIGPSLLEDPIGREKIHRFDHERIPERVVHARGTGAHGFFRVFDDRALKYTSAGVLTDPARTTPVFVRFSTVQGSRGSAVRIVKKHYISCTEADSVGYSTRCPRFRYEILHS